MECPKLMPVFQHDYECVPDQTINYEVTLAIVDVDPHTYADTQRGHPAHPPHCVTHSSVPTCACVVAFCLRYTNMQSDPPDFSIQILRETVTESIHLEESPSGPSTWGSKGGREAPAKRGPCPQAAPARCSIGIFKEQIYGHTGLEPLANGLVQTQQWALATSGGKPLLPPRCCPCSECLLWNHAWMPCTQQDFIQAQRWPRPYSFTSDPLFSQLKSQITPLWHQPLSDPPPSTSSSVALPCPLAGAWNACLCRSLHCRSGLQPLQNKRRLPRMGAVVPASL